MFVAMNLLSYIFLEGRLLYPKEIGKKYIFLENIQDIVNIHGAYYQNEHKTGREPIQIEVAVYPGTFHHFADLYSTLKKFMKFRSNINFSSISERHLYYGNFDLLLIRATFIASPTTLHPVYSLYDNIWVKGDIYQGSPTYFLDTFDLTLWLAFLIIFLICLIIILLIKKIIARAGAVTSFDIISLILNQGVGHASISTNLLCFKIVLLSLSITLILFHSGFGAFLSSLLVINKNSLSFHDFNSMLEQNEYTLCLRDLSAAFQITLFEKQHNPKFKVNINGETCPYIFQTNDYNGFLLDDPIKAECRHDKVIFMSSGKIKHFRLFSRQCGISPIKGRYINQQSSLLVRPNFKYREQFNKVLIRLRTTGVIQNMQLRETLIMNDEYGDDKTHNLENHVHSITFHHIHLILIAFLAFGGFMPLLILLGEIIWKHSSQ